MRWLSLIAVLCSCTLITDPDSFEGNPVDAGADASDDGATDGAADTTTDGPDCMEGDMRDPREVCFGGRWTACDVDGDGFRSCAVMACSVYDEVLGGAAV